VQRRFRLGPVDFWHNDYLVTETQPKVVTRLAEFGEFKDAESYVRDRLRHEPGRKRHDPFAIPKGWQVAAKYADLESLQECPEPATANGATNGGRHP